MTELEPTDDLIKKLNELLGKENMTILTPSQIDTLVEIIDAWDSVKGFVKIMRYAGASMKWCLGFAVIYAAFKTGVLDFLGVNHK